ncbi:hypothetical protein K7432_014994 [Basidiobolus ranarum]|uniref:GPI anchored serine-threonine rich protein n=1 Tax=Basidiobolus ranarum TaxID=34480 RepID=A0ABR2WGQ0_9FUNG
MKFTSALVALAVCLVSTQSVNAVCTAQANFDLCIKNSQAELDKCGTQDFVCRCQQQQNVAQCYQQCPDDPIIQGQAVGAKGLVTTYCGAVPSANSVTPSTPAASAVPSTNPSVPSAGNSNAVPSASTSSGASAAPGSTNKPASGAQSITFGSFVALAGLGAAAMNM